MGDVVRRLTSESTAVFKNKNDTAYTHAKFVYGTKEGTKKKEEDGMREKEQLSRGENSIWKKSFSVKVQFEASEDLLGPDDMEVDLRRILKEARDDRGRNIFETFGFEGLELPGGEVVQMGQIQRSTIETRFVSLSARDGWWQVSLGQSQEQMVVGWSQDEKR